MKAILCVERMLKKVIIVFLAGTIFAVSLSMARLKPIKIEIDFEGKHYIGTAKPVKHSFVEGMPHVLKVTLQNRYLGFIHCEEEGWKMNEKINPELVRSIGGAIDAWYRRVVERRRMREFSKSLTDLF